MCVSTAGVEQRESESELESLRGRGGNKGTHVMRRGVSILGNVKREENKCEINGLGSEETLATQPLPSPE